MKRIRSILVGTLVLAAGALHAQQQSTDTGCGNATLKGAYAVAISGVRPNPNNPYVTEQVIGVAIQNFDGAGNFTQIDNVKGSHSGVILNRSGSGTYSVNADCTGTYTLNNTGVPFPLVIQFVIVSGGSGFRGVVISPQAVMVAAEATKV